MARILVVDDFPDVLDCMKTMLTLYGHEVTVADSARDALGKLGAMQFDVLISDISMPEMNGLKLLEILRASNSPNKSIYAIALTGYSRELLAGESTQVGFNKFVMKTNNEALLHEIDSAPVRALNVGRADKLLA